MITLLMPLLFGAIISDKDCDDLVECMRDEIIYAQNSLLSSARDVTAIVNELEEQLEHAISILSQPSGIRRGEWGYNLCKRDMCESLIPVLNEIAEFLDQSADVINRCE